MSERASRRAGFALPGRARLVQVERPAGRTTWTRRAWSGCLRWATGSPRTEAGIPERPGPGLEALAAGGWSRVVGPECQDWTVEHISSKEARLIIIAGQLHLDAADRDRYLTAVADVACLARKAPGCHDFVQAADPIDAGRINVFERWESDDHLHRFRASGEPLPELPALRSAEVHKYRISGIEAP